MKRITITEEASWNYDRTVYLLSLPRIEHCATEVQKRGWVLNMDINRSTNKKILKNVIRNYK